MSSKLIGADSEFFSKMVVEAAQDIKVSDGKGGYNYPIKAINDLCLKYFVEAGAMAVRRCKKADLKRIAKVRTNKKQALNGTNTFQPIKRLH